MIASLTLLILNVEKSMEETRIQKKIFFLQLWIVTKIDDRSNKEVFFNNWFSSLSLISILKECVIRATWLLIRKQCKINKKDLKHQERVFIQTFYTKQGVMVVSCNDNGPVLVISSVHRSLPSAHSPQSSVGLLKWVPKRQAFELHFVLQ